MKISNLEITARLWGKIPTSGTLIIKRIQIKNVTIIHKWLKHFKCQQCTQVAKRLQMSTLNMSNSCSNLLSACKMYIVVL